LADVVTDAIDDLTLKLQDVNSVKKKVIYLYDQDDLLDQQKKLGFPAVGIVYVGMRGNTDSSKTGLAVTLVCDIYLIGGEQCIDKKADLKSGNTKILDEMRSYIACSKLTRTGALRKWKFVAESPTDLHPDYLGYVQRWSTVVLLTS